MQTQLAMSFAPVISRLDRAGVEIGPSYQAECHASWKKAWGAVTSYNSPREIEALRPVYPGVTFAPVDRDARQHFGRPLIYVADILRSLRQSGAEIVGLINSDILFTGTAADVRDICALARRGVVAINRAEISGPTAAPEFVYRFGYDAFFFPADLIDDVDMEGFALGAPWWDYWLLFGAAIAGRTPYVMKRKLCGHLTHPQQWSPVLWRSGLRLALEKFRAQAALQATRKAAMGQEPGPSEAAADFLFFMADQSDLDRLPAFGAGQILEPLGVALGLYCVDYVERTGYVVV